MTAVPVLRAKLITVFSLGYTGPVISDGLKRFNDRGLKNFRSLRRAINCPGLRPDLNRRSVRTIYRSITSRPPARRRLPADVPLARASGFTDQYRRVVERTVAFIPNKRADLTSLSVRIYLYRLLLLSSGATEILFTVPLRGRARGFRPNAFLVRLSEGSRNAQRDGPDCRRPDLIRLPVYDTGRVRRRLAPTTWYPPGVTTSGARRANGRNHGDTVRRRVREKTNVFRNRKQ